MRTPRSSITRWAMVELPKAFPVHAHSEGTGSPQCLILTWMCSGASLSLARANFSGCSINLCNFFYTLEYDALLRFGCGLKVKSCNFTKHEMSDWGTSYLSSVALWHRPLPSRACPGFLVWQAVCLNSSEHSLGWALHGADTRGGTACTCLLQPDIATHSVSVTLTMQSH